MSFRIEGNKLVETDRVMYVHASDEGILIDDHPITNEDQEWVDKTFKKEPNRSTGKQTTDES